MTSTVSIGGVAVGDGHPTVFMAEVGTFFNQDIGLAKDLLRQVAAAGAPVFKSEILHDADAVVLAGTGLLHEYRHGQGTSVEDYRALMERKCNPLPRYAELMQACADLGLPFVASIYDRKGADFFADHGGAAIKIARSNIDNLPLIRHSAGKGLPMIIDAGGVTLDEIARAVREAQDHGAGGVVINHHPGANPAPPEVHNLVAIRRYKEFFGVPVGLACHYRGEELLYAAVGLGLNLIEKGVDLDPDRAEQDLISAARLDGLADIIAKVNNCWAALGCFPVRPQEPRDLSGRAGMAARRNLAAGEAVSLDDVHFCFPPLGISAGDWDRVANARLVRPVAAGQPVRWRDLGLEEG